MNTKDPSAQAMAHKRWAKTTPEERKAHSRKMNKANAIKNGWKYNKENESQVQKDINKNKYEII